MIYCVVPEELTAELLAQMEAYYADDPNVTVIIDRRKSERRKHGQELPPETQRETRDRRRPRVPGDFPAV